MRRGISASTVQRSRKTDGRDPVVGVRLPPSLIKKIDKRAKKLGLFRSEAIRLLLESGLAAEARILGTPEHRSIPQS